jgi:hypothetical protein
MSRKEQWFGTYMTGSPAGGSRCAFSTCTFAPKMAIDKRAHICTTKSLARWRFLSKTAPTKAALRTKGYIATTTTVAITANPTPAKNLLTRFVFGGCSSAAVRAGSATADSIEAGGRWHANEVAASRCRGSTLEKHDAVASHAAISAHRERPSIAMESCSSATPLSLEHTQPRPLASHHRG